MASEADHSPDNNIEKTETTIAKDANVAASTVTEAVDIHDDKTEATPVVDGKIDEISKDAINETPFVGITNGEKPEVSCTPEPPKEETEEPSDLPHANVSEQSKTETTIVEPAVDGEKNSEYHIETETRKDAVSDVLPVAEPKIEAAEKTTEEQLILVGAESHVNAEPIIEAPEEPLKEQTIIAATTDESDKITEPSIEAIEKSPEDQLIVIPVESDTNVNTTLTDNPVEDVAKPPEGVESDKAEDNSSIPITKLETVSTQEGGTESAVEADVREVNHSIVDVPKQVSSEDIISDTPVVENGEDKIEKPVKDETKNVDVAPSAQAGEQGDEIEDLLHNAQVPTPVTEVLPKDVAVDTLVETVKPIVTELADVPPVSEASEKELEPDIVSDSVEAVVKEVTEDSINVPEAVETVVTEASKIAETPTETTNLPIGDVEKSKDETNSVEATVKEVIECGAAASEAAEKLAEAKNSEEPDVVTLNEPDPDDSKEEIHARDLAVSKDSTDVKVDGEAVEQAVVTKTRSPNMISKVKRTLVKAKKAIFGKSPSSKTVSETKAEAKP